MGVGLRRDEVNIAHKAILDDLQRRGWGVLLEAVPRPIPEDVGLRYGWLPRDIRSLAEEVEYAVSPDEKAWLNTAADLSAGNASAFQWNQWEIDSLAAAGSDARLRRTIRTFWDRHFPVMISLKSGYAYFAIRAQGSMVVRGEEPEYEHTTVVADSFTRFLELIRSNDPRLARWI